MSALKLEHVKDCTERECRRFLAIGQPPAVVVALERRLQEFALERARGNAMALLMQQTPEQQLRSAAGLIFSAASQDENAGRQEEIAELSTAVEKLASELRKEKR